MKSTPRALRSSTTLRPSAALATGAELGKRGVGPSSIGPAMTMRGPNSFPAAMSARHCMRTSRSPPMSRTPVTPLATNMGSTTFSFRGIQSPNTVWTCMSQSPGIRYFPAAFTTFASAGACTSPLFPRSAMCPSLTMTVMSGCNGPPVASMTFTCVNARVALGGTACSAKTAVLTASARKRPANALIVACPSGHLKSSAVGFFKKESTTK